jgi:hypothetical protein
MNLPIVDWFAVCFFLCALAMVRRLEKSVRDTDAESYRYISVGLAVLALTSLYRLYGSLGLLDSVPFLSEALFFKLTTWTAIVAGSVLLISGVSTYLPRAQRQRRLTELKQRRLRIIRDVEQLTTVEHRDDELLARSLMLITDGYEIDSALAVRVDEMGRLTHVVDSAGVEQSTIERMESEPFVITERCSDQPETPNGSRWLVRQLPAGTGHPVCIVPIEVDDRLVASFLLWGDVDPALDSEMMTGFTLIGDILGRGLQRKVDGSKLDHLWHCLESQAALADNARSDEPPPARLSDMFKVLKELIDVELLSLRIRQPDGRSWDCLTVGSSGKALHTTVRAEREDSALHDAALAHGYVEGPIDAFAGLPGGPLPSSLSGALACTIKLDGAVAAWLVCASAGTEHFGTTGLAAVRAILPWAAANVLKREADRKAQERADRMQRLSQILEAPAQFVSTDKLCQAVAEFLADELDVETVRVGVTEPDSGFLHSRALAATKSSDSMAPAESPMILSLMPVHTEAAKNLSTIAIPQDEMLRRVPESERAAAYRNDLSHMIVAAAATDDVDIAVITVADSRSRLPRPIDADAVGLCTLAARLTSAGIRLIGDELLERRAFQHYLKKTPERDVELTRTQVRSFLTGLLGSVEMLKDGADLSPDRQQRCLSIIDRSARGIERLVTQDNEDTSAQNRLQRVTEDVSA